MHQSSAQTRTGCSYSTVVRCENYPVTKPGRHSLARQRNRGQYHSKGGSAAGESVGEIFQPASLQVAPTNGPRTRPTMIPVADKL